MKGEERKGDVERKKRTGEGSMTREQMKWTSGNTKEKCEIPGKKSVNGLMKE